MEIYGILPLGKWVNTSGNFNLLRISEGKIVEWWYETNPPEVDEAFFWRDS